MQVQTHVKAGSGGTGGGSNTQHNEAQVRAAAQGLKVQTNLKAGARVPCPPGSERPYPPCYW